MWQHAPQNILAGNTNGTRLHERPEGKLIPFDYVSTFDLKGERIGELHEDVINVSVEGTFIAVAVGYGLAAENMVQFSIKEGNDKKIKDLTLKEIPPHVLMDGFRLNPSLDKFTFVNNQTFRLNEESNVQNANQLGLFQWTRPATDFSFLFSMIDTSSGREIQNAPIHSIAGLGKSNGERPFRNLAKPLAFLPRSSVRIQVEECSLGIRGRLYIVLHGYKILNAPGVPEQQLRLLYQRAMQFSGPRAASQQMIDQVEKLDIPSTRVIPFDSASRMKLIGKPGNVVEDEININVEGGFVATSMSYSLSLLDENVAFIIDEFIDNDGNVDIGSIPLEKIPVDVLKDGFRIKPEYQRLAFTNGQLSTLPVDTVQTMFERLNLPDQVNFLYSIIDTGTGREWQNQPVQNIAGLGIANGNRPFRQLSWPMMFLPRSTIRLRVEEIFGRGELFVVFQGYKLLGTL